MPKVTQHKKNKVGEFRCDSCSNPIIAGEQFFSWAFRYGGKHYQHTNHGSPKPSQLTQSKMSAVYAATEAAGDAVTAADNAEDIASALEECSSEVEQVKDEYQESIDNMGDALSQGPTGQDCQEKVEALESFCDELSSAADEIRKMEDEPDESEESGDDDQRVLDALQSMQDCANEALDSLSI